MFVLCRGTASDSQILQQQQLCFCSARQALSHVWGLRILTACARSLPGRAVQEDVDAC